MNLNFAWIPIIVSFFISVAFIPLWVRKARSINLVWEDVHKNNQEKVAGSGGIVTLMAFMIGVFVLIYYKTFFLHESSYLVETLSLILVVLFAGGIGFIDDLLGWHKGGLPMRARLLLVLVASIPLMAINAGRSGIFVPFFGGIELGLVYPLILIPLGVVGATTTFNMLAGMNGLEAGQGIILTLSLGVVAFLTGSVWLAIILLCMAAALTGFLIYNYYPAKIFPGDVLTYSAGSIIAASAILGNFEKIAVFFFIPYIIETLLKSRGKLRKHSFGKVTKEGYLEMKYDKIYSLNHLAIWIMQKTGFKASEKRVVLLIWSFQIIVVLLGFFFFGRSLI